MTENELYVAAYTRAKAKKEKKYFAKKYLEIAAFFFCAVGGFFIFGILLGAMQ